MASNTPHIDFEGLSFNPFLFNKSLFNENNDPDGNSFNDNNNLVSFESQCFLITKKTIFVKLHFI